MNRILFDADEICDGVTTFGGERAEHVLNILHGEVGQVLKTGVVNGPIGTSRILTIEKGLITAEVSHAEQSLAPWVDLILAPPRPRVMKRLLPQLATMGVGRIVLVGAKKVEKDFWGATLLKEENYRPLLIDGLMQGGTSVLPILETRRNFRKFLNEELEVLFPQTRRIVAHPYEKEELEDSVSRRVEDAVPHRGADSADGRLLLAIGPEGGWSDEEVALLETKGFARYSLGRRILRTDTATIALLAKLNTEDL